MRHLGSGSPGGDPTPTASDRWKRPHGDGKQKSFKFQPHGAIRLTAKMYPTGAMMDFYPTGIIVEWRVLGVAMAFQDDHGFTSIAWE